MNQGAELFDHITFRSDIFIGKPIIREMPIAVEHVLAKVTAVDE